MPSGPGSVVTVTLRPKVNLEPNEAMKYLIDQVPPDYPAEAKAARIQGTVSLSITIDTDGSVKEIKEISGPRELIRRRLQRSSSGATKQSSFADSLARQLPWWTLCLGCPNRVHQSPPLLRTCTFRSACVSAMIDRSHPYQAGLAETGATRRKCSAHRILAVICMTTNSVTMQPIVTANPVKPCRKNAYENSTK